MLEPMDSIFQIWNLPACDGARFNFSDGRCRIFTADAVSMARFEMVRGVTVAALARFDASGLDPFPRGL